MSKRKYKNKFIIHIEWKHKDDSMYNYKKFIKIKTDERKEWMLDALIACHKEYNFTTLEELMNYFCATYDMKWKYYIPQDIDITVINEDAVGHTL